MEEKKIINVRSQKAYDLLMKELDSKDIIWVTDRKASAINVWNSNGRKTVICIYDNSFITYGRTDDLHKEEEYAIYKPKDFKKNFV